MALEAGEIWRLRQVEQGRLDFSAHASVSNAAAPGVLIRTHTPNCEVRVTDVIIYNSNKGAAIVTFYDETSDIKLVVSLGDSETVAISLKSSIPYGTHDIYARTSVAANAEITVTGREIPPGWA
jgi:hypothetical protein